MNDRIENAIIVHGLCDKEEYFSDQYPSLSNSHWMPWLQKQLLIKEIETQTPEMPQAYYPAYQDWKKELERYSVHQNTILIGHSCGGGFLVRWLSENPRTITKLILVAPWLNTTPEKNQCDKNFFNFTINSQLSDLFTIHLLYSEQDNQDVLDSVSLLQKLLPSIQCHHFPNYGHFCLSEMGTEKFPELRDLILS